MFMMIWWKQLSMYKNAPRKSCSRTIDDEKLARPVKETDLLLLGSAHPVPREDCFRRWQSIAWRVSNSPEQWAHLNPTAWGRLGCPAGRITHGSSLQGPGIFPGQLSRNWIAARQCRQKYCSRKCNTAVSLANLCSFMVNVKICRGNKRTCTCARITANEKICTNKTCSVCVSGNDNLKIWKWLHWTKSKHF